MGAIGAELQQRRRTDLRGKVNDAYEDGVETEGDVRQASSGSVGQQLTARLPVAWKTRVRTLQGKRTCWGDERTAAAAAMRKRWIYQAAGGGGSIGLLLLLRRRGLMERKLCVQQEVRALQVDRKREAANDPGGRLLLG